ncbi:hypothetical protein TWF694_006201 [Orbilia ellipsospora]|uniref:GH16 domain-containing protein n=1 Tax=Orbilia ellipsospora TaxID=2528407 RepID=A0AAV9XR37_9PEZI
MVAHLTAILLLLGEALAVPPALSGYSITWYDEFDGALGGFPTGGWTRKVVTDPSSQNSNDEVQYYTEYSSDGELWGDGQLFIIPHKKGLGTSASPYYWTSSRFETTGSWSCPAGKAMIFQANLRGPDFTNNPSNLQGIWPAFWAKGNACRNGGSWPDCGEWDIYETINDLGANNQATLHYKPTNSDHAQFSGKIDYTGAEYHTWAVKVDRRNSDWTQQKIIWYRDGTDYLTVTGSQIGNLGIWTKIAYSPFYMILNVAVGGAGSYGGAVTPSTIDGTAAALRIKWVAVYHST